jgi:regulatory protein
VTQPQPSFFEALHEQDDGAARRDAMDRAGTLLARRARSESEVRDALARSNFTPEVIDQAIDTLRGLDLVDDGAFARQWIEERGGRKGLGPRRLLAELRLKGVADETARGALDEVGLDDEAQAKEVAARLVRKVANRPLRQQAMRLQQMLLGRGFGLEVALLAVRSVLPPEGWD